MVRKLFLGAVILALGALAFGCGGSEDPFKNAKAPKPIDLGDPAGIPMGVSTYGISRWIVKENVDGENHIWAVDNKIPGPKAGTTAYDPDKNIFYDETRKHTYDTNGIALHKIPTGPKAGGPGVPLPRYRVGKDEASGHVLLYSETVPNDSRNDVAKGAYVVVP